MRCKLQETFHIIFSVAIRIAILATAFAMFAETSLKKSNISFASELDDSWLLSVFKAALLTMDAHMFFEDCGLVLVVLKRVSSIM